MGPGEEPLAYPCRANEEWAGPSGATDRPALRGLAADASDKWRYALCLLLSQVQDNRSHQPVFHQSALHTDGIQGHPDRSWV